MELLFASTNPHKVSEVRAILAPLDIEIVGLADVPGAARPPEPDEDGDTFADNARIKAVFYAKITKRWCLADDSGLEVDALDGAPGVRSARYAGGEGSRLQRDAANNRKLLAVMAGVPNGRRTARFTCAMSLADPGGAMVAETRGVVEGEIARAPRGDNGFGYDPLFWLPGLGCTSAELPPEKKNALSHRGDAARRMVESLHMLQ